MDRHTQLLHEQRGQQIIQAVRQHLPQGFTLARVRRKNIVQFEWWVCYEGKRVGGFALDGDSNTWYRLETKYTILKQYRSEVETVRSTCRYAPRRSAGRSILADAIRATAPSFGKVRVAS